MATEKKKSTKKTTAKKSTTKKATAKKTPTKKSTAKKPTAKKTTTKKPTTKKTSPKGTTTKKSTVKKTTEKPKSGNLLPKVDINNIMKNVTTLPLMVRMGISGFPLETTYFDTEMCAKGFYHLVHNNGKYFLFLPKWKEKVLQEMQTGKQVIITRGSHEGKKDSFEIMFDDETETPFSVLIRDEQFTRLSPLKEGWHGTLYVYSGDIDECRLIFPYVYYRITDNLPCLEPVKEERDKSHGLPSLNSAKEITEYLSGILKNLLESGNFPMLSKRFSLEKLTNQLVKRYVVGEKIYQDVTKTNFEIILTQLDNSIKW